MIQRLALIFAAAFLVNLGAAFPPDAMASGPKIEFGEKSFDFGSITEVRVLEHSYKVFNRGDQTLQIEKVSPT